MVVLIIDKSWSVLNYKTFYQNAINEINRLVKPSSIFAFSNHIETLTINNPIENIEIQPSGMTSLYDCVCGILDQLIKFNKLAKQPPSTVIILTDGDDTNSHLVTFEHFKFQINRLQAMGWKFIFLGVTQKAIEMGKKAGCNSCILYNFTEQSFTQLPKIVEELISSNRDSDVDITFLEKSIGSIRL